MDATELTKKLIEFPSVTPVDAGCLGFIETILKENGFVTERLKFAEIDNLYAKRGSGKNFCFAGHTDVVPAGDIAKWTNPPFNPTVKDGNLYGRGASDMKAAVAASIIAAINYKGQGAVSLLLTADEEGEGINGTVKVLETLDKRGEKIDACIVGEPTSVNKFGDMAKIGRRGSMNCKITVQGRQGHAAYPQLADNPVKKLINILHKLQNHRLDKGSKHFQPSNLEVVTFDVGNPAANVIPNSATATFNIRFNDKWTSTELKEWIEKNAQGATLEFHVSGESFITKAGKLSDIVKAAVKEVTGLTPELSTTGGTSDARFISKYTEVVELGLCNATAHKIDENVPIAEIEELAKTYAIILQKYFA